MKLEGGGDLPLQAFLRGMFKCAAKVFRLRAAAVGSRCLCTGSDVVSVSLRGSDSGSYALNQGRVLRPPGPRGHIGP